MEESADFSQFVRTLLRGVGQVMFQRSAVTGLFFLVGILVASPQMALGAIVGVVVATITAKALGYDRQEIDDGVYGFNGTLVGIALVFYEGPGLSAWLLVVVAAAMSSAVTHSMRSGIPFPTYTAPFVVTAWVALAVAMRLGVYAVAPTSEMPSQPGLASITEGISEVMFQANAVTGILFLVGIAISSWTDSGWALVGSIVGLSIARWHHDPAVNIATGIYGYNAALAAMALWLYRPGLLVPLAAAAISVPITEAFPALGVETLTAPFVLASWITIAVANLDHWLSGK